MSTEKFNKRKFDDFNSDDNGFDDADLALAQGCLEQEECPSSGYEEQATGDETEDYFEGIDDDAIMNMPVLPIQEIKNLPKFRVPTGAVTYPPSMILQEPVDVKKLALIVEHYPEMHEIVGVHYDHKTDKRSDVAGTHTMLKNMLASKRISNEVVYTYAGRQQEGRMFAKNSLQGVMRTVRHTIAAEIADDIDIVNCHPVLLQEICKRKGIECPELSYYIENRSAVLQETQAALKCSKDDAKKLLLRIMNGGGHQDITTLNVTPFIQAYYAESQKILQRVSVTEKQIMAKLKRQKDQYNIKGRCLNKLLCKWENKILHHMILFCNVNGVSIIALCFDGCMLFKPYTGFDYDIFLSEMSDYIESKLGIRVSIVLKPMTEGIDLTKYEAQTTMTTPGLLNGNFADPEEALPLGSYYIDFRKLMHTRVFQSEKEMIDIVVQHFPKVAAYVEQSNGFYVKRESEENKFAIMSAIGIMDFYYLSLDKQGNQEKNFISWTQFYRHHNLKLPLYNKIVFKPEGYDLQATEFNTWDGFQAKPVGTVDPGKFEKLLHHIKFVWANGNEEYYNYLRSWLAVSVKKPWLGTRIALLIQGNQGAGKTMICSFLMKHLYGYHLSCITTGIEPLTQRFNSILKSKLFINANELCTTAENFSSTFDKMKPLITEDKITIEVKGIEPFQIDNYANFILTTNHKFTVKLEADDRRYAVFACSNMYAQNESYFKELVESLNQECADHFITYLKAIPDEELVSLRNIPMTDMKKQMMNASVPVPLKYLGVLKQQRDDEAADSPADTRNYDSEHSQMPPYNIQPENLYALYKCWCVASSEKLWSMTAFCTLVKDHVESGRRKFSGKTYRYFDLRTIRL